MMVQPKTPPLSIRPGPERLSRIDAYAAEHKLTRHLAILLMLDEGHRSLTRAKEPVKIARRPAQKPAAKFTGRTALGEALPERGAYQKKPK